MELPRHSLARCSRARRRNGTRLVAGLLLALLIDANGCRAGAPKEDDRVTAPSRPIAAVIADHAPRLMALGGVTAVGESALPDGTPCIRVFLRARDPELQKRIPRNIEGHPVVVVVSGEIRAMPGSK